MVIDLIDLHPTKALLPIVSILFGISIDSSEVQPLKAEALIVLTLLGTLILINVEHSAKVPYGILFTPSGKVTETIDWMPANLYWVLLNVLALVAGMIKLVSALYFFP